jgi:enoyl-CoA hydratase
MANFVKISNESENRTWHICRPDRLNALSPELVSELLASLQTLTTDLAKAGTNHIRSLTISAETVAGKQNAIWMAGGDLKELAKLSAGEARTFASNTYRLCVELAQLPIPVITVLDGDALGGAAEFFLWGDIRLATDRSRLCFKQLEIGLPSGFGGAARLKELTGLAIAQRAFFYSEIWDAARMQELAISHESPQQTAMQETLERVRKMISSRPFEAIRAQKQMLLTPTNLQTMQMQRDLESFESAWKNEGHKQFLRKWEGQT